MIERVQGCWILTFMDLTPRPYFCFVCHTRPKETAVLSVDIQNKIADILGGKDISTLIDWYDREMTLEIWDSNFRNTKRWFLLDNKLKLTELK